MQFHFGVYLAVQGFNAWENVLKYLMNLKMLEPNFYGTKYSDLTKVLMMPRTYFI